MYQKLFENWRKYKQVLEEARIEGGMTIRQILETLDSRGDKTWIVFDTETMGFDPVGNQITEIAAVALKVNGWEGEPTEVDTYHKKIHYLPSTKKSVEYYRKKTGLTPAIRPESERGNPLTPDELAQMTGYGEFDPQGNIIQDPLVQHDEEQKALEGFYEFCEKHGGPEGVVLCAQNATFDLKMINTRIQKKPPRYDVFDTVVLFRLFLIPVLRVLTDQGDEVATEKLEMLRSKRAGAGETEYRKSQGTFSSSLGDVRKIYNVTGAWHAAIADVKMLIQITAYAVQELRQNPDLDIMDQQAEAAAKQHAFKTKASSRQRKAGEREELASQAYEDLVAAEEAGIETATYGGEYMKRREQAAKERKEKDYQSKVRAAQRKGKSPESVPYPSSGEKKKMIRKIRKSERDADLRTQGY